MKLSLTLPLSGRTAALAYVSAIALCLLFSCSGCAHTAKHFAAPDSSRIETSARKLSAAVTSSRAAVLEASTAVQSAQVRISAETLRIASIEPKLSELLRVSPPDLRPSVAALQEDVTALHGEHDETTRSIETAIAAQAVAKTQLDQAAAAKAEIDRLSPDYLKSVASLTAKLNADELAWGKDSKALAWYRLHWLLGWVVMLTGIAGAVLIWGAKIVGKVTVLAAKISARFAV